MGAYFHLHGYVEVHPPHEAHARRQPTCPFSVGQLETGSANGQKLNVLCPICASAAEILNELKAVVSRQGLLQIGGT
ncbi:hypothetical protein T265_12239 [Opisthorchis viverrini]|uniref:Uncharacterized protein n=1 Tax=Opisthorchis viverrini TaxID=6198 RepID=A0A074Z5E7_OPIVI|nr:hypothetical protein T265_12239 [Opisthorchis viverrini]KER18530.1 hypothetical protein T265_12239 [Opisthorchis viverrini]